MAAAEPAADRDEHHQPDRQQDPVAAQDQPEAGRRCRRTVGRHGRDRPGAGSGAGTAPPASAAGWSGCGRRAGRAGEQAAERGGVDVADDPVPVDASGRARRAGAPGRSGGPASSASIEVRVRWRSSASVPVSTVRPSRMMVTRSHSASTSARMWLDSSTVRPRRLLLARCTSRNTSSISGSRPGGRLVEDQQLDVGGERGDQGDLLPVALGVGAALLASGRARSAPAARRAGAGRARRAAGRAGRSPRRRSGSGHSVDVAGHVGEPPVQRGGVAPRVAAEQRAPCRRRRAAARAGPGWSWTCRRRWGRGSRAPRRCATLRSSPSSARVRPERLDQALDGDDRPEVLDAGRAARGGGCGGHAPDRTLRSELCEGTES